jgi:hypothetical protein
MDKRQWRLRLGIILAVASAALFVVHFLVFRDLHHLGIFTLHDIAFLPLEVLIVTLILHALLEQRQHSELLQKLNMIIGAFFSEVGIDLLRQLAALDSDPESLARRFDLDTSWDDKRLKQASAEAAAGSYRLSPTRESIRAMQDFMCEKRQFLLGLLENQSLLENERFTDVLWAVFHLGDELSRRTDLDSLPESDIAHLAGDMERAYGRMISEWFEHLRHLKVRYPYLYSLAVRSNPLDTRAVVEVQE